MRIKFKTKNLKSKKAYLHTLEAFLAFFITFSFLIYLVHQGNLPKPRENNQYILHVLEKNEGFRQCIYAHNTTCAEELVEPYLFRDYQHKITINELEPFTNNYDIIVEQLFIVGNQTNDFNIVKLYYWNPG